MGLTSCDITVTSEHPTFVFQPIVLDTSWALEQCCYNMEMEALGLRGRSRSSDDHLHCFTLETERTRKGIPTRTTCGRALPKTLCYETS